MEKYIKPEIKVRKIEVESEILAASGVDGGPTGNMNVTDNPVTDPNEIGAKRHVIDWDEEEEY